MDRKFAFYAHPHDDARPPRLLVCFLIEEASMTHRVVLAFTITIFLAAAGAAQTNARRPVGTDVSAVVNPLFANYCISCHSQTRKTAGLALDSLNTKDVSENAAVWEKILRRLRTRRDPAI